MPLLGLDPPSPPPLHPCQLLRFTSMVALDKGALEGNEEKDWALSTAMMLTTLVMCMCAL